MFPAHRPSAAASTTGIVLTLAALAAGPIASATASPVPEPSTTQTTQTTQTRWQATVHEIAAGAPSTNSLAVRRMLLLIVVHFADAGVIGFADGLGVKRPRPRVAGGAVVGVVTGCSAW